MTQAELDALSRVELTIMALVQAEQTAALQASMVQQTLLGQPALPLSTTR